MSLSLSSMDYGWLGKEKFLIFERCEKYQRFRLIVTWHSFSSNNTWRNEKSHYTSKSNLIDAYSHKFFVTNKGFVLAWSVWNYCCECYFMPFLIAFWPPFLKGMHEEEWDGTSSRGEWGMRDKGYGWVWGLDMASEDGQVRVLEVKV